MNYKIYKLKTGHIHFSQDIAEAITMFCLSQMENSDLDFKMWKVGVTNDKNLKKGSMFRMWPCTSYLQAAQTNAYFVNEKIMVDDTPNENGDETFIYVFQ